MPDGDGHSWMPAFSFTLAFHILSGCLPEADSMSLDKWGMIG